MCLVYNMEQALKLGVTSLDWLLAHLLYFLQRGIPTESEVCMQYLVKFAITVVLVVFLFIVGPLIAPVKQAPTPGGQRTLVKPALAAQGDQAFPSDKAGISAYIKLDRAIDLEKVATLMYRVEDVSNTHIIGTVQIPNFGGDVFPHLYTDTSGWVVAYFLFNEPSSLIIQWAGTDLNNPQVVIKTTVLEDVIRKVTDLLAIPYETSQYYHFRYPEANAITLLVRTAANPGSQVAYVKVPATYKLFEASYYHYAGNYHGYWVEEGDFSSELKLGGAQISRLSGRDDLKRAVGFYPKDLFILDKLHELELTYSPNTDRGSAGMATVLIYRSR
jgi:hypothetical protein